MISEIQIKNFKSIADLSLQPGSVTVLIGENGSGKSNILEAIAFAAAASADKLDDEFLFNRGIRVTDKIWMRSAFVHPMEFPKGMSIPEPISISVTSDKAKEPFQLRINELISKTWEVNFEVDHQEIEKEFEAEGFLEEVGSLRKKLFKGLSTKTINTFINNFAAELRVQRRMRQQAPGIAASLSLKDFLIYAPENAALRNFATEGAIKPLGIKGEGLLQLLSDSATSRNPAFIGQLREHLSLLDWFGDIHLPSLEDEVRGRLRIQDRWLEANGPVFDQRNANEGFLYLLFYFTLFLSEATPKFFAIDNIDNALNPKLCAELMRQLAVLAEKTGKQVICTTHNPAILDGLNLHDDKQRLYVVRRNSGGHTIVNRVKAPGARPGGTPVKLSSAFMSGLLGGLPEHF